MENKAPERKPRVLSLIQPTAVPTIGNYFGALKNWKAMSEDYDCLFGVADLHAITVRQEPAMLRKQSTEMFALLLANGLDPEKSIVFMQSHVPQHSQLAWLLSAGSLRTLLWSWRRKVRHCCGSFSRTRWWRWAAAAP